MKCLNCDIDTKNPKFCSQSCSASYFNRVKPKRAKSKICHHPDCKELILSVLKFCSEHKGGRGLPGKISLKDSVERYTKGSLISEVGYATAQSYIRVHSRNTARSHGLLRECHVCGYSNHVQAAHIIPVKDFPDSCTVLEVNSINNLVGLCPNHHWEFDNGMINLVYGSEDHPGTTALIS